MRHFRRPVLAALTWLSAAVIAIDAGEYAADAQDLGGVGRSAENA